MNLAEKRAELGKLVTQARTLNDACEGRAMTAEEDQKWKAIDADITKAEGEIRTEEERLQRASRLTTLQEGLDKVAPPATKPTPGSHRDAAPEHGTARHAYAEHLRNRPAHLSTEEYRDGFRLALAGDLAGAQKRASSLQAGLFTLGGALQPPTEWLGELLKGVDNDVFVRKYARIFRLEKAASLGVPKLDTDIDDADWTSELLTGNQGDFAFGTRELRPHPMAKRVLVSKTLSRVSALPIDQFVRERLRYKVSITDEKAFLTGDGNQKPLGIFTASANGVSTGRDVSTDNTTTEITADNLMEVKGSLKSAHLPGARWIFHRTALTKVRKLKDGNGQYLWQPGLVGGTPNQILEQGYDVSEYAPNTFTTGLYVGALCNWQFYWIADALDLVIQYVDQLYAATNQDGYIARRETDGMPVLEEAFARVKLA